ncbi:hypothetical protein [Ferruginibacter sp. SUN106]|uniref:hypothetical protein n=1 Tax=Ferruginibacter sp. SUN106 TaxID=2978348 RepID=UPI003D367899
MSTKIYKHWLFIVSLLFTTPVVSQVVENTINLYGQNFSQEKIHIHFDKEAYLPGETIWFKAYLFEDYIPAAKSTNFYTSLYDENGKLVQQLLCPIFNGTADGHFQIPDSLQSKQLICRAYTTWMLNLDTTLLFTKAIRLINNDAKTDSSKQVKTVSLQFFPEGGDIIEGVRNTIAFKANYNNGLPFEINGVLKKQETGEVEMPVKSVHDGMGRFDIEVAPNQKFYVEWLDDKGVKQQTYLPQAKSTGVSLKLAQVKDNVIFNLTNKTAKDSLHVLMYLYQKVFYKNDLVVPSNEPFTATVQVNALPSGIMQLTVFDANWQPVAERVAFINNNNYALDAKLTNTAISTQKRGKNSIEIEVADTILSNMSLSVTDAELNDDVSTTNIVTDLLLSGDVKGYIHNPAYYFTSNTNATLKSNLDLVMLTHGWRRYNWDNMLAAKMPELKYPQDNYLSIYGRIGKQTQQKLDAAELVNLIVKSKDSTQNFYFVKPDAEGIIKQTGLVFYDSAKVQYSFNKNKLLNPVMVFSSSNYTYPQPLTITNAGNYLIPDTAGTKFNQTASVFGYYIKDNALQQFNKEKTMQAVLVKNGGWHNWKNDPLFKLDQKYAEGAFRGVVNSFAYDVMHDEMAPAKLDIYNYMIGKAPGLGVYFRQSVKTLVVYQGPPPYVPCLLYVNERPVENEELTRLNIEDIAYVKFIPHLAIVPGLPPAISIYLKKGDDLIDNRPKDSDLRVLKVAGYSPQKEFYAPDYSQSNTATGTDARTTLLWQPYILTDATNQKVPITFYNNDFTKKIRIVLEGFNDEGKLIHIEKIVE